MKVEGAQLKEMWRFLLRKSESNHYEVKMATLASMVLQYICLNQGDTIDPLTRAKGNRATVRDILLMKSRGKSLNPNQN